MLGFFSGGGAQGVQLETFTAGSGAVGRGVLYGEWSEKHPV